MFPLFVDIYVKIFFNVVHVQEHAPCILYYLATFIIRKVFFIKPISYKIYVFILDNMRISYCILVIYSFLVDFRSFHEWVEWKYVVGCRNVLVWRKIFEICCTAYLFLNAKGISYLSKEHWFVLPSLKTYDCLINASKSTSHFI